MRRAWVLVLALGGCGGSVQQQTALPAPAPAAARAQVGGRARVAARPRARALARRDVVATVKAGLGRFLQRVDVEPSLRDGRFQGFRILELKPPDFWQGVDLRPGDVITRVNGRPIETEMQAFAVFQSLKTASALRVSYVRDGQPRQLVYAIVGTPAFASRPAAASP